MKHMTGRMLSERGCVLGTIAAAGRIWERPCFRGDMFQDSTPPLLRGIGTTVILVATMISFAMARHPGASQFPIPGRPGSTTAMSPRVAELEREVEALRREVADDHLVEEVFGNPWFEWLGFIGTGFIATSFYIEWGLRRRKARA